MDVIRKKMAALREKLEIAEQQAQEAEDKLDEKNDKADEAEKLVQTLLQELSDLEDELDGKEDRLTDVKGQYNEAVKQADESERAHKELSNRGQIDNSRLYKLEREIEDTYNANDKLEVENEAVAIQLEECEQLLEDEENRFTDSDTRVKELDVESVQTGNLLRSMEINEDNAARSESKSYDKLEEMKRSLKEKTIYAEESEDKAQYLEQKQIDLDDELTLATDNYHRVKADYDALLAEVAEIC